jgi:hypothetical protein
MTGDIDVHTHMIPTSYAQWLRDHGVHAPGDRELPEWSPDLALELMDRHGIATAILSLSTPGVHLDDGRCTHPQRIRSRPRQGPPGQVRAVRRAHPCPIATVLPSDRSRARPRAHSPIGVLVHVIHGRTRPKHASMCLGHLIILTSKDR